MTLDPDAKLRRVAGLRVDLDDSRSVFSAGLSIVLDGDRFFCPVHGLAILDVFSRPTSMREALDALKPRLTGPRDLIDLTNTIVSLYTHGLLVEEQRSATAGAGFGTKAFDTARAHVVMLNDRARTESYLRAIAEVVRAGDVVVDIGTGTGVLAMAAARAGAAHVYAIEVGRIGQLARSLFAANGLADRITLVQGWSTQVTLPRRADVLVSEIIGNEPLSENVLEVTSDAVTRLLTPDARLIPNRLRILALPVAVPASDADRMFVSPVAAQNWSDWYGMDFTPLATAGRDAPSHSFIRPSRARSWTALAEPALLADLALESAQPIVERSVFAAATAAGEVNGVLVYFELELSPWTHLSVAPDRADEACSWLVPVWVLPHPVSVVAGDRLVISYTHRGPGMAGRVTVRRA
jgi:hypothetical protein